MLAGPGHASLLLCRDRLHVDERLVVEAEHSLTTLLDYKTLQI